ncbi:MAG: hypothetical protein IKA72_02825 [Clostridia bacterium]|nr:hypothetical protein [Clostridia bacterium]
MKLEKQKITLNERDSVLDVLYAHERLLQLYLQAARYVKTKQMRALLKERVKEVLDEVYLLQDLLESLCKW